MLATADKGIQTTNEIMETNERQRFSATWTALVMSFLTFRSLILAMILDKIEHCHEILIENTPKTLSSRVCKILLTVGNKKCIKVSTQEDEEQGTSE